MTADGRPLRQGRETPGVDGDCRFLYTFPSDGDLVIQVRDLLYGGAEGAWYRLRVTDEPFATVLFPLGGARGRVAHLSASGGNLAAPLTQALKIQDDPGAILSVPPFESARGRVASPFQVIAGDGPEVFEPTGSLALASTVNGRIGRPGEVDRYALCFKNGEKVVLKVVSATLGSWLDSVVTIRNGAGAVLAENDDATSIEPTIEAGARSGADSRLEFTAESDGGVFVELTDRFRHGGPEFGYRLSAGDERPDFSLTLLLGTSGSRLSRTGAFRVRARCRARDSTFRSRPKDRPAHSRSASRGLPEGVTAEPITARPSDCEVASRWRDAADPGDARPEGERGSNRRSLLDPDRGRCDDGRRPGHRTGGVSGRGARRRQGNDPLAADRHMGPPVSVADRRVRQAVRIDPKNGGIRGLSGSAKGCGNLEFRQFGRCLRARLPKNKM